ncbi:HlyD family secretion protein [Shewanella phaeophyticola]|uniref:HlyD family secretion protein n=1 Tax=Shewanella phaeophyticola TaxID=2978345 RepID=A0ABT2P915_9GAMM|nr:HlyD family secretion protein [Shewanella sp. KJ10-1]MCT8988060.1 HlyD family secretion protein [Shewanella sp. KJ10-1]
MAISKSIKVTVVTSLFVVAIGGVFYLNQPESANATQSTDDAYIQADFTLVSPQIAGKISQVFVDDNDVVKQGDVIATLDDRDFVAAVNTAKAQVVSAQASIKSLQAKLLNQDAVIEQAQATLDANISTLKLAQFNLERYRNLATDGSGTVQAQQEAEAQVSIEQANLRKNEAGLLAAKQNKMIQQADIDQAKAALQQAQSMLDVANLQLSYTQITAPIDGIVGKKSLRVGSYVNPGVSLLAVVPLDQVYVHANFRETQLANVKAGQAVNIEVDALPGKVFTGHVDSLAPASGVSYSAVAPHNATGNFTKIVQRLPVKIIIDAGQVDAAQLRVGMSVVPTITVNNS